MADTSFKRQKYTYAYTHIDISKIYKSKKAGQLLLPIWINKTKWVNEWCDKESYLKWFFSVVSD